MACTPNAGGGNEEEQSDESSDGPGDGDGDGPGDGDGDGPGDGDGDGPGDGDGDASFTIDSTAAHPVMFEWQAGTPQHEQLDPNPIGPDEPDYKFRMAVAIANDSYDDPIVFPHQRGRAHHHLFLGNGYVDEHTTNTPGSMHDRTLNNDPRAIDAMSGRGVNRSGYWVPIMYDHGPDGAIGTAEAQADDRPMVMGFNQIYYVKAVRGTETPDAEWESELEPMPEGLQIITAPNSYVFNCSYRALDPENPIVYFEPVNGGPNSWPDGFWPPGAGGAIPQCDTTVANNVSMRITFPDCWDEQHLTDADDDNDPATTSPDSRHDHMAYSDPTTGCPDSHPVQLGTIQYNFQFPIRDPSYDTSKFYLSSDVSMQDGVSIICPEGEHGCTNHGDWMNGWQKSAMEKMVDPEVGCLGSLTAHCAAGQLTSDEALQQPEDGPPNWMFDVVSFQYEFEHDKPILLDPLATTASFTFSGTGIPEDRVVTWEAGAVCEGPDGTDFSQTFTQEEIAAALVNDPGFPDALGTYTFDWLLLGVGNYSGKHAHASTNHDVPCTGFCFRPTVEAAGEVVVGDCE